MYPSLQALVIPRHTHVASKIRLFIDILLRRVVFGAPEITNVLTYLSQRGMKIGLGNEECMGLWTAFSVEGNYPADRLTGGKLAGRKSKFDLCSHPAKKATQRTDPGGGSA